MSAFSKFASGGSGGDKMPPEKLTRMLVGAIIKNDEGGIKGLLGMGADPDRSDEKGNTPLVIAATDPREHGALKALLESKVSPNVLAANGKLPLHAVLRMKDERIMLDAITLLLAAGADPNMIERRPNEYPMNALQTAMVSERSDKIIAALLDGGADPLAGEDASAGVLSPLHVIARGGRYPLLEAAFAQGISVDKRDFAGKTCLIWAAKEGMVKSIEMLLERGADPTVKDSDGKDAMAYARLVPQESGRDDIMRMLARASRDYEVRREIKDLRSLLEGLRSAVDKALSAAEELKAQKQ
jgi:ankyrin repeat protein